MFWILLFVVGLALWIVGRILENRRNKKDQYRTSKYDSLKCLGGVMCILGTMLFLIFLAVGTSVYPTLNADKERVSSLRSEISTIQNARYGNIDSGKMVGGSLDNMSQSTALSTYISEYAQAKADYNKDVVYYQIIKEMPVFKFFGYAMFLSSDVHNLPLF